MEKDGVVFEGAVLKNIDAIRVKLRAKAKRKWQLNDSTSSRSSPSINLDRVNRRKGSYGVLGTLGQ